MLLNSMKIDMSIEKRAVTRIPGILPLSDTKPLAERPPLALRSEGRFATLVYTGDLMMLQNTR